MQFTVSSSALLKQLTGINGAITPNPIIPILENFLFSIEDDTLKITASDLQSTMIARVAVTAKQNLAICIPAKMLMDTLKTLADQPIVFKVNPDTLAVHIKTDNGNYKVAGEKAEDYPKVPSIEDEAPILLNSDYLSEVIGSTLFAISNDELRPSMTGLYFEANATKQTFVSTDGHRLVQYSKFADSDIVNTSVIIPKKGIALLKGSLPHNTEVAISISKTNIAFAYGSIVLITRLIDERFPDYSNAIPKENPNELSISRSELLSSLRRVIIFSNKQTSQVRLKIALNEVLVSAEDMDMNNEASETLGCNYNGTAMEIGFNAKFLIEMLSTISSEEVLIKMSAPNRAALLSPVAGEDNLVMLLMPVMLNN
jgi:DNA polymerase III subunit beta